MFPNVRYLWLAGLALTLSFNSLADTVMVEGGSTLVGKVKQVADGKLTLETDFAGTLQIDIAKVKEVVSSEQLTIQLESGNRLVGTLARRDGVTTVHTSNGPMDISKDAITSTWRPGEPDPAVAAVSKLQRKWAYEANVDITGRDGNTNASSFGGGVKATLKGPEDRLLLYLNGKSAETNGIKSSEQILGGIDFERKFEKKHSWYTRIELEKDRIKNLDQRTTAAAGYGYYLLAEPNHELRLRLGALYRHEDYLDKTTPSKSSAGVDMSVYHMFAYKDLWKITNEIVYTPSIEDTNNYRVYHESAFEIPLKAAKSKLRLGVSNEYVSPTADDVEALDTYYFLKLVFNWGD